MVNKLFFNYLSKDKLTILLFHKVPKTFNPFETSEIDLPEFQRILEMVLKIFRILPLEEAMLALERKNLPPRSACITFDDGYSDWMHGVVPVLEKNNVHATFFITTGQFNGKSLWNERILHSISKTENRSLNLKKYGLPEFNLSVPESKNSAILQINNFIKYEDPRLKEYFLRDLELQSKVSASSAPVMEIKDLRLLHSKGFGIGAHTITHPILSRCDAKLAFEEIAGSREELIAVIGAPVRSFAYPNGIPGKDFGLEHVSMLEKAGYSYGLTTRNGFASRKTSCWEIPRFTPWRNSRLSIELQFARNFQSKSYSLLNEKKSQDKVLMVAFHFPPQSGSSGIQRTLNFVKYLPSYGWNPTVLSAQPRAYLECSDDLLGSIPSSTNVIRAFALDAAKHLSIKRKYPGFLAIPDRWSTWWFGGIYSGLKIIRRENPSVIWTTYPIATAHMIGATLSRITGLPWVADFRDPMINGNYPPYKLQRKFFHWIESKAMARASRCIFTTERAAQKYIEKYPNSAHKCMVIENGYDESVFSNANNVNFNQNSKKVLMLHSGIIYPVDRDPSSFLIAIRGLINEKKIEKNNIIVRFRAPQHEAELLELVQKLKMEEIVEIFPSISYVEAIAEMQKADLLLVFQGKNFNAQVPAKIYEYIRAGRSIMGMLDLQGDTAAKLKEFDGVHVADINSPEHIKNEIYLWLENSFLKNPLSASESNFLKIKNFSRKKQTGVLSNILYSVKNH